MAYNSPTYIVAHTHTGRAGHEKGNRLVGTLWN